MISLLLSNKNRMESLDIKFPNVKTEIHPLIKKRWSPRSFSDQPIQESITEELLEAASWAASASNEQPWVYFYAHKGTEGFQKMWECLMPGNQPWAKDASVIFAACYRKTFASSGKTNGSAPHDLGMANAQLMLQAAHRDIYGHFMGGYYAEKLRESLQLEEDLESACMGVLGYLGEPEKLEEPFKTRELTERSRNPVSSFAHRIT
jgi:nitroreductase